MNDADTTKFSSAADHDRIPRIAYAHWEKRGRPYGSPEVDWHRAEEELRRRQVLDGAFTSSLRLGH